VDWRWTVVCAQVELVGSRRGRHIVRQDPPFALGQAEHQQFHDALHQAVLNLDQVVEPGLADIRPHQCAGGGVDQFCTDSYLVSLTQDGARQHHVYVRLPRDVPGVRIGFGQAGRQQAGTHRERAQPRQ
jgi:hypothetical protein